MIKAYPWIRSSANFRSKASGNWNSYSTWEIQGEDGVWYDSPYVPESGNSVDIQAAHTIELTEDVFVSDLSFDGLINFNGFTINNGVWPTLYDYKKKVIEQGSTISTTEEDSFKTLLNSLIENSLLIEGMELCPYAGSDLSAAKVKLIYKTGNSQLLVDGGSSNFVSGDYSQSVGMTGGTNKWFDSGFNANTVEGTDVTLATYMKANVKKTNTIIGIGSSGNDTLGIMFYSVGTPSTLNYFISKGSQSTNNNSNQNGGAWLIFNSQGFYSGSGNSTGTIFYRNGKRMGAKAVPGTGFFASGNIRTVHNFSGAKISVDFIIPRALTDAEHTALNTIVQQFEADRVRTVISYDTLPRFVFTGDSLTFGQNTDGSGAVTEPWPVQFETDFSLTSSNCLSTSNAGAGVPGWTITQMKAAALLSLDDLYDSDASENVLFFFGGTNDLNSVDGATTFSRLVDYCTYAKSVGFKIIVGTLIPGNSSASYNAEVGNYNSAILTDSGGSGGANRFENGELADGIADISSIPELADNGDLTYFMTDGTHMRNAAYTLIKDKFKEKYLLL